MKHSLFTIRRICGLVLLSIVALLIQGYHPYAEDAEIYLPGVLKILHPSLFPANADFFGGHASYSLYPKLMAASVRLTHLPLPWAAFLWQFASIFLLLAGTWRLAAAFFQQGRARCGAAILMATLLTLPIAGTALYILDQYLNPRNLAAFAAVFAVAEVLHHRYAGAVLWLVLAAAMHPLMSCFAIALCVWLAVLDRYRLRVLGFAGLLPFGIFDPPPPAYQEGALRLSFFFFFLFSFFLCLVLFCCLVFFLCLVRLNRCLFMYILELVSSALVSRI